MESPFELMRRYWNPAAVLDALDIKAWPPSVDEEDDSFHGRQHPAAREESPRPRRDAPSVAPRSSPASSIATGFGRRQQQQQQPLPRSGPPSPTRPWLSPRDAAMRIQSAYRGHRVRESVRRVAELEVEVGAVEMQIMASLDRILGDDRERARVNEMIMDVLVRLDGVKGCCREYRKSVIKKAISIQEALDCLVGGDGGGGSRGGDAADTKHLKREDNDQGAEEEQVGERAGDDDDDDQEHGNISDDDDEDEEEEEERSRSSSGCGGVKEALIRVREENTALRGLVRELMERNDQQAVVMQQLTERVDYLERKLQRLGRKRRRSRHGEGGGGAGGGGGGATATAASFSSSSSAGEGEPDHDEDCRADDGQGKTDLHDGGCRQPSDRQQR